MVVLYEYTATTPHTLLDEYTESGIQRNFQKRKTHFTYMSNFNMGNKHARRNCRPHMDRQISSWKEEVELPVGTFVHR